MLHALKHANRDTLLINCQRSARDAKTHAKHAPPTQTTANHASPGSTSVRVSASLCAQAGPTSPPPPPRPPPHAKSAPRHAKPANPSQYAPSANPPTSYQPLPTLTVKSPPKPAFNHAHKANSSPQAQKPANPAPPHAAHATTHNLPARPVANHNSSCVTFVLIRVRVRTSLMSRH